jgi:hypothetical protein
MKPVIDADKHEKIQVTLMRELIRSVKKSLEDGGAEPALVYDLTEGIAASIASILDGSHKMDGGKSKIVPMLGFLQDPKKQEVLFSGKVSSLHDYVTPLVEEIFEEEEVDADDKEDEEEDDDDEFEEEDEEKDKN